LPQLIRRLVEVDEDDAHRRTSQVM
jgi:hypothetical protein